MTSLAICVVALIVTFQAARRSLGAGVGALLTVGYFYGIIRANQLDGFSHLIFDSALLGLYAARLFDPLPLAERIRIDELRMWVIVLVGWPVVLFLVPQQDMLVELVGLRGNVWMLPCLVIGARMTRDDWYDVAVWIAVLNLLAGVVAAAEFVIGIEPFFPRNVVTELIYRSGDVAGNTAHRIPSFFTSAHAYGGAMVLTLPPLIGAWMQPSTRLGTLFAAALVVSVVGIFVAAARTPVLVLLLIAAVAMASGRERIGHRLRWVVIGCIVAYTVAGQERLQRFTTLQDPEFIAERISGSVNMGFIDLVSRYPMGNGLGGGGTSIPYFLQSRVRNSVAMENEYARIALEQGIPGLLAWTLFVLWFFLQNQRSDETWFLARRLMKAVIGAMFLTCFIGTGLLTAIPSTAILLLTMGWVAVPEHASVAMASAPAAAAPRLNVSQ